MQGSNRDAGTEKRLVDTVREGEGGTNRESSMETCTLPYVKYIASENLLYDAGSSNKVICDNLERWDGMGGGREVQERGDIYAHLWLIHADLWQKPTKYCKAIVLQLKIF